MEAVHFFMCKMKKEVISHKLAAPTCSCCVTHQWQHTRVSMWHREVTEFLWLARHTDLLYPDLHTVRVPASDLAMERRVILWSFGLSPVVRNFFSTRKCQGRSFLFHTIFRFLITCFSSWLQRLGNSAPRCVQKHVCAISHSVKIYLPSKHSNKFIQSWRTDLKSHLAELF